MAQTEYKSTWLTPRTGEEFMTKFEQPRMHFGEALIRAYQSIVETEMSNGDILSLGIGTGQVEKMAGIDPRRIMGVEYAQHYATIAQERLPGAEIIVGNMEQVLPLDPRRSIALASDSLDCISPPRLPEVLRLARDSADTLVATHLFTPDDEFYAPYNSSDQIGSRGGPGIEGWRSDQQESADQYLKNNGLTNHMGDAMGMVNDVQGFLQKQLGGRFETDIAKNVNRYTDLAGMNVSDQELPNSVRLLRLLIGVEGSMRMQLMRMQNGGAEFQNIINVHSLKQIVGLLNRTVQTELYFNLLSDACREAGYKKVERKAVTATPEGLAADRVVASKLKASLGNSAIPQGAQIQLGNSLFVNGSASRLYRPFQKQYNIARVQYLVAS